MAVTFLASAQYEAYEDVEDLGSGSQFHVYHVLCQDVSYCIVGIAQFKGKGRWIRLGIMLIRQSPHTQSKLI